MLKCIFSQNTGYLWALLQYVYSCSICKYFFVCIYISMACGKPQNNENVLEIIHCDRELVEFKQSSNILFLLKDCLTTVWMDVCIYALTTPLVMAILYKQKNACTVHKISFSQASVYLYWTYLHSQKIVIHEIRLSNHTFIYF